MFNEEDPPPSYTEVRFTGETTTNSNHNNSLNQQQHTSPGLSSRPLNGSSANVAPPSYQEVLEAEGTGLFPVIGSRARDILNRYHIRSESLSACHLGSNVENVSNTVDSSRVGIDWQNDSIYGSREDINSDSCEGIKDFCYWSILFTCAEAFPLTMIIMGVLHLDDCPLDPYIPQFIITSGITAFLMLSVLALSVIRNLDNKLCNGAVVTLFILLTIINLWGSVIIFQQWTEELSAKVNLQDTCHYPTYLYGFSMMIIFWLGILSMIVIGVCTLYEVRKG